MTSHFPRKSRISKVAFAAAVLCSSHLWVNALPLGGAVSAGAASISTQGVVTSIYQSAPATAINWQSFNLAAGEAVRVMQPNSTSVLLNRVLSAQPSQIFGTLSANGQVFLVNPNGILFGAGSSVNTAGLVASTLNLSDADFVAGRYQFAGPSLASIINQGSLNSDAGYVALYGAKLENQGVIKANGGKILLSAQSASELMPSVVNNTGVLQAQALENRNGTISLVAMGPNGTVNAGGILDVSGLAAGQSGGRVILSGQQIGLWDSKILASGDGSGGHVQVGTDQTVANASNVATRAIYMSAGSDIQASANKQGDAGSVILKASDIVRAHGQISARGGEQGGNGGLIETSAENLSVNGLRVDARAPQGHIGTWILDPADITISSAATTNEGFSANVFAPVTGASSANINVGELVVALNTANVTVTTQNTAVSGAGQGDIDVNSVLTWTAPTTLSLNAARDVNVNQAITGTDGSLTASAGRSVNVLAAVTTTTGNLEFTAVQDVNLSAATTITTGHLKAIAGGQVNFSAASTITGGDMLLRADNDGTGPGVSGGTVSITCGLNCITLTNGVLSIRFNPASETTLPAELIAYASNLTGATHTLDAKAWMFAKGVDKPYDANTTATLALAGGPAGATLVPGTANFVSKDVATQRSINYSAYTTLGAGTDHLLWSPVGVAAGTGTTSANITAIPLTITALGDQKIANGVPYSGGNGVTYSSFAGGESQADLGGTLTYGGSAQGAVSVGSYVILPSGRTSPNYTITYSSGTLNIDGSSLVITPTNVSKAYGQTAALTGFTAVGLLNGDTVTSVTETSLGSVPTASVLGGPYAIIGSGATGSFAPGNYVISYVNGSLTVLPAPLLVTANNATKSYGQTGALPATGFTSLGLVNGDTLVRVVNTSTGTPSTAPVAGSPYVIVPSAAEGNFAPSNYSLSYQNGALTVTPAELRITANDVNKIYGQSVSLSPTAFSATGLVNGDTVVSVNNQSAGAIATAPVAGSPYAINPSAATGGFIPGNYTIAYIDGALAIRPAPLTITANDALKTYGQTLAFSGTSFGAEGLVNGDLVNKVVEVSLGQLATALPGNTYPIVLSQPTGSEFEASNYSIVYVDGALTVVALPAVIPTGHPFDTQVRPPTATPVGMVSISPVMTKPAELLSLSPPVAPEPVRALVPVMPTMLPSSPVLLDTPVATEERPLPSRPVLVRPRKQDRN